MRKTGSLLRLLLSCAAIPAGAATSAGPSARALASAWVSGTIQYTHDVNAITSATELGTGNYVSFLGSPLPTVGSPYYVAITMTGMGDPAIAASFSTVDFLLPPGTTLYDNASWPLVCLHDGNTCAAADSPQPLSTSIWLTGGYQILRVNDPTYGPLWPIVQGHTTEFHIPVVSSAPLSGSNFLARINATDGTYNETVEPTVGVFVQAATTPTISYATPSTTSITNTSGHSVGTIFLNSLGGTYTFDLGTTTAYGLISEGSPLASGQTSVQVYDDWGPPALTPGTLYHWRLSFTPTGGTTVYGADQTFTTTGTSPTGLLPRGPGTASGRESGVDPLGRVRSATGGSGIDLSRHPASEPDPKSIEFH
jgi:hypothetical protein